MESISKEEYEKMTEEEQLLYSAKYINKNIYKAPAAKALAEAIQNEKVVEKISNLSKRFCDGEPVNKNPLTDIPNPEMRLYYIDDNYFESIDELLEYCRYNNKSTKKLNILDYYRSLAGHSDVIRKSNSDISRLYTAVDEDGYGIYNNERSIYRGEFTWEYNHGSIREMYEPFRDKGVIFENDIYGEIEKRHKQLLKYCRENNLFNMGQN